MASTDSIIDISFITNQFLDAFLEAMVILNADGEIMLVNRSWCKLLRKLELNETQFCQGNRYQKFIDALDLQIYRSSIELIAEIERVANGERAAFEVECCCRTSTGFHWFKLRVSPLSLLGQSQALLSFEDITEQKRREFALTEKVAQLEAQIAERAARWTSEENYRDIFVKNHAIKLVINPEDGAIIDANPAAANFYLYPLDILKQMKVSDINILPQAEIKQEMALAVAEQRKYFNFRHRLANGEIRDVEIHSTPMIIAGKPRLYSIIHDITERKQAEKGLKLLARRQAIIAQLGQHALAGIDLDKLIGEVVNLLGENFQVEFSLILRGDANQSSLTVSAAVGWQKQLKRNQRVSTAGGTLFHYALTAEAPLIIENLATDQRFRRSALLIKAGITSGICVKIQGGNTPIGLIGLFSREPLTFKRDDIDFIQSTANLIALAVERKIAEENRSYLLEHLIDAQEQERRAIARELHDEAGQSLTSLLVGLRLIDDVDSLAKAKANADHLRAITMQILNNLKRLARGLHPSILDDLGLSVALNRQIKDYADAHKVAVKLSIDGFENIRLPLTIETAIYRIVQEALTNIAKYARAENVQVKLLWQNGKVEGEIRDDGVGFDVESTLRAVSRTDHLGLYGMRERVTLLGGTMVIESKKFQGTSIKIVIPVKS